MPQLIDVLRAGTPQNRRAAAEALGPAGRTCGGARRFWQWPAKISIARSSIP